MGNVKTRFDQLDTAGKAGVIAAGVLGVVFPPITLAALAVGGIVEVARPGTITEVFDNTFNQKEIAEREANRTGLRNAMTASNQVPFYFNTIAARDAVITDESNQYSSANIQRLLDQGVIVAGYNTNILMNTGFSLDRFNRIRAENSHAADVALANLIDSQINFYVQILERIPELSRNLQQAGFTVATAAMFQEFSNSVRGGNYTSQELINFVNMINGIINSTNNLTAVSNQEKSLQAQIDDQDSASIEYQLNVQRANLFRRVLGDAAPTVYETPTELTQADVQLPAVPGLLTSAVPTITSDFTNTV